MTKWIALPAACVAAAALVVTVEAAPKTTAKSSSPKTKTTTTTKSPSTSGSSTKAKPASPKSTTAKADHAGGSKAKAPKTTTTTAKGNGSSKKASTTTTASTSDDSTPPSGTTTTTTWQPTNAVSEKLMTKPNQLAKLKAVLPAGTDINDATAGFKNFGQLNAAVNVSQNLGIDFADLKAAMTGITLEGEKTGQPTKSLGQSIQQFKPGVDGDAEAAAATARASREAGQ